jgi:hypothetical protein
MADRLYPACGLESAQLALSLWAPSRATIAPLFHITLVDDEVLFELTEMF